MTNPPSKDKISCLLKDTRQNKGITLEMVHEATKIPLDVLKSIEQGYSVHKLQTFYYRGFIKIYAKYLELDETRVLQEYGVEASAAPKPQPSVVKESKSNKQISSAIPVGNTLRNAVRPVLKHDFLKTRKGQLVVVALIIVLAFLFFRSRSEPKQSTPSDKNTKKSVVKVQPASTTKPKVKETAVKETSVKEEKKEVSAKPVTQTAAATPVVEKTEDVRSAAPEAKSDKTSKPIELTVRATKSGWLQVKVDGQVIFQSTLKKGDAESWKAQTEIELSGKNINLLEFELNGKMLGALGASDRGAKKVVFTKDGLSVKK